MESVRFTAKQRGQRVVIEWCGANRRAIWWPVTGGKGRSKYLGTYEFPELIVQRPQQGFSNIEQTS